jgi:hypothetical protein
MSNYGLVGFILIMPLFFTFAGNLSSPIPQRRALTATLLVFSFSESLVNFGVVNLIGFIFMFLTWNPKEVLVDEVASLDEANVDVPTDHPQAALR